jgi:hypothetical protein
MFSFVERHQVNEPLFITFDFKYVPSSAISKTVLLTDFRFKHRESQK